MTLKLHCPDESGNVKDNVFPEESYNVELKAVFQNRESEPYCAPEPKIIFIIASISTVMTYESTFKTNLQNSMQDFSQNNLRCSFLLPLKNSELSSVLHIEFPTYKLSVNLKIFSTSEAFVNIICS